MPSRRDQLHSYQYLVQRVVAALVLRETDPARSPFRRAAGAALASVLVAGIALGGMALYGALAGTDTGRYRDGSVVIVERESGARYVFRDGRLHPVLNYASALLIVGTAQPRTVLVSRRSIEGVPRGTPLGIGDAPDSLPRAARLAADGWTVCSTVTEGSAGRPESVLLVGAEPAGARPLDGGLLVRHPDGSPHLLWHGRRHLVRQPDLVLSALAWTSRRLVPVAPALLNALPAGADLAPVRVPDAGRPSGMPDVPVGEVFVVATQGGDRQYAVARVGGLAGITEMQADLLLTARRQAAPTVLPQGRYATLPKVPDLVPTGPGALPARAPRLVEAAAAAVCGRFTDSADLPQLRLAEPAALTAGGPRAAPATGGGPFADRVMVAPGGGAVVEAMPAPGAPGGAVCLVTDLGRRYVVPGGEVLAVLGYQRVRPIRLPSSVVTLLPAGQALDPAAARAPVVR
ncbi:type VII secretion protein EccB [Plantactinospora sp. GCM10030261]|uniref:type VII secretion protein EccB n=1 Tax=Plantactinospora sp. GCM10030261 TaxID=3273420 RepID=UPI00360DAC94